MKKPAIVLGLVSAVLALGCAAGPAPARVVVRPAVRVRAVPAPRVLRAAPVRVAAVKPPPPAPAVVVARPARPGRAYVWRDGHYVWANGAYVWVAGGWVVPPAGKRSWRAGRWNGSVWISGRWV